VVLVDGIYMLVDIIIINPIQAYLVSQATLFCEVIVIVVA
jgi:hypothetical protein